MEENSVNNISNDENTDHQAVDNTNTANVKQNTEPNETSSQEDVHTSDTASRSQSNLQNESQKRRDYYSGYTSSTPTDSKHDKKPVNGWKIAWIVVGVVALTMASGAIGGYFSARHEIHRVEDELEKIEEKQSTPSRRSYSDDDNSDDVFRYFFGEDPDGGLSKGDSSGSSESQENTNKAALGIMVQDTENGVKIVDFSSGTNAEDAGLKTGDIIVKADGENVSSVSDLRGVIAKKNVGDSISITVKRNGKVQEAVKVKLIANSKASHPNFPDGGSIKG